MTNPFRGLIPFEEKDRDVCFERDADVDAIVGHLWSARVCLLFAGSGVGKTSFLRAKLVPHLRKLLGDRSVFSPERWAQVNPVSSLRNLEPPHPGNYGQTERSESATEFDPQIDDDETTKVLILDQFEEVFQYFPDASLLNKLGKELAGLVSSDFRSKSPETDAGSPMYQSLKSHDTRIIISVREEFLAELSTFDSFLPNLLSNYYRLERPTTRQAQRIIEKTAALENVPVDQQNLSTLLDDLRTVLETRRKGVFIDPPYLQIVCKQFWEDKKPSRERPFLSDYHSGMAEKTLKEYCDQHLNGLTWREKVATNKAIGFLTIGKYQAKRSVRLREIEDRLGRRRADRLSASLDKLSAEGVKIFRRWDEQPAVAGSPEQKAKTRRPEVYALYHDMYAPMLWDWRERQERTERTRMSVFSAVGLALLFFFILWPFWKWMSARTALDRPEYGNAAQFADVLEFRNALAQTIIGRPRADAIWRNYTEDLASQAALKLDTDGAFLYRLAGNEVSGRTAEEKDIERVLASEKHLTGIFSVGDPRDQVVDATLLKDEDSGDTIVAVSREGHILTWPLQNPRAGKSGKTIQVDYGTAPSSANVGRLSALALSPPHTSKGASTVNVLVAWVYGDVTHGAAEIHVAEFSWQTGDLISEPYTLPLPRPPATPVVSNGNPGHPNRPLPQPFTYQPPTVLDPLQRLTGLRGFYSPSGGSFAIVDSVNGEAVVRMSDKTLHDKTLLRLRGAGITRVTFNDEVNPIVAVTQRLSIAPIGVVSGGSGLEKEKVSFIRRSSDPQHPWQCPGKLDGKHDGEHDCLISSDVKTAELPRRARLFFSNGRNVVALVNKRWSLVSPDSSTPLSAPVPDPPDVFPQGATSGDKGAPTIWMDIEGVIGYDIPLPDKQPTISGSISSGRPPQSGDAIRTVTTASLSSVVERKRVLTIDDGGKIVRVWEVPAADTVNGSQRSDRVNILPPEVTTQECVEPPPGFPPPFSPQTKTNQPLKLSGTSKSASVTICGSEVKANVVGDKSWSKKLQFKVHRGQVFVNDQGSMIILNVEEQGKDKVFVVARNRDADGQPEDGRAAFSADGEYAVIAAANKIRVLGPRDWSRDLPGTGQISNTAVNNGGSMVIVSRLEGSSDGAEKVFLLQKGAKEATVEQFDKARAQFSADGKHAAIASPQGVTVFGEGKWQFVFDNKYANEPVTNVIVSADGARAMVWLATTQLGTTHLMFIQKDNGAREIKADKGVFPDGAFGPGNDKVTLVSDRQLLVWSVSRNENVKDPIDISGAHIVRSTDEQHIVLYSRFWLYYLTENGTSFKIRSEHTDFPLTRAQSASPSLNEQIRLVQSEDDHAHVFYVPVSGQAITQKGEAIPAGELSMLNWFGTLRINICDGTEGLTEQSASSGKGDASAIESRTKISQDPGHSSQSTADKKQDAASSSKQEPSTWHSTLCTYTKRMDRQVGKALNQ